MMMEEWNMIAPCTGGKRPRSPVEKLAEMGGAEGDENWRSSKRYFTEVISSGFSKLSFGKAALQQQQQEQHGSGEQHPAQQLLVSPRSHGIGCYVQLPLRSPREEDMDMMQESPTWPGGSGALQRASPRNNSNRLHRAPSLTETFQGVSGGGGCSPMSSPVGNGPHSPGQYPFGSYPAPGALPKPAWQIASAAAAATPVVPKSALKTADKPPNSPSDLPATGSNLRKVALLRSLLSRTEQLVREQQQCMEQQQQQQHHQQQQPLQAPEAAQQDQYQQHASLTGLGALQEPVAAAAAAAAQESRRLPGNHGNPPTAQQHGSRPYHQGSASTTSDEMDCSSSSMADSDSSGLQIGARGESDDRDLAATSLLCTEVLPFSNGENLGFQRQHIKATGYQQHCAHLPFAEQQQQLPLHALWGQQQGGCHLLPVAHQQQQQQILQHLAPIAPQQQACCSKLKSPELSRDKLEALRAKALAGTSKLSEIAEPEDLHTLLSASQARRGSVDHVPSRAAAAAEARRHSSHI